MLAVVMLCDAADRRLVDPLRSDLAAREWSVTVSGFAVVPIEGSVAVWVWPANPSGAVLSQFQRWIAAAAEVILVEKVSGDPLPDWVYEGNLKSHVIDSGQGYDRVFEDLYRALVGPLPGWVDVRARPSQVARPTGCSWWTEDVFVADERFDHVVRLGPTDSAVIIPGLFEPHHIEVDRRRLRVANKAADEVIKADLDGDLVANLESITLASTQLLHPHDFRGTHFLEVVADTDNHRVAIRVPGEEWSDLRPTNSFLAPCGLQVTGEWIWVADTFNHRIVAFSRMGHEVLAYGSYGQGTGEFMYPVGIYQWQDWLFVADEGSERLMLFRVVGEDFPKLEPGTSSFGHPFIKQPFGLSVNRENRLAVSDRQQKCIWLIDLVPALQELDLHDT